jgi:hypothetical protein
LRQRGIETYKLELTNKKYNKYKLLESDEQVVGPENGGKGEGCLVEEYSVTPLC